MKTFFLSLFLLLLLSPGLITPPAPTLLSPSDGATNVSRSPSFDWSDVESANGYDVVCFPDDELDQAGFSASTTASNYTYSGTLGANTVYKWKVRATYLAPPQGDWSSTFTFKTGN